MSITFVKNNAENGFVDPNSDEFTNLKELAKRFALSFGVDTVRIREPVSSYLPRFLHSSITLFKLSLLLYRLLLSIRKAFHLHSIMMSKNGLKGGSSVR